MLICEHMVFTHGNATNKQDKRIERRGSNTYTPLTHLPLLASGTDTQSITTHTTFAVAVLPLRVTNRHMLTIKKYNTSTFHSWPSALHPKPYTPPKRTLQYSIRDTDRTHIGGHARTRRASTPSSDPRYQPPPYPISSSASLYYLTCHSFGVGTGKVSTPAIVR